MQHLFSILALGLVLSPDAQANEENTFGVFQVNASLTTGPASGFRQVFVDANDLNSLLKPAAARAGEPNGQLVIENISTAWARVHVGETLVGIIGPLTTGRLQNVTAGTYTVSMELPNGYTKKVQIGTVAADGTAVTPQAPPAPAADQPDASPEAE
ncbi:MAG: hypothetical protein VX519_08820 [Myxococcota bacterium]|nr:hypothetical protein [Myxococcota bacterium]